MKVIQRMKDSDHIYTMVSHGTFADEKR